MKLKMTLLVSALLMAVAFSGCTKPLATNDEDADMSAFETPKDFDWSGSYIDDVAGLAVLSIEKDGKDYKCTVNVPSEDMSHIETYDFTAKVTKGTPALTYENGVRISYMLPAADDAESGVTTDQIYEDGTGSLYYLNGEIFWVDDRDNAGENFMFKNTALEEEEETEVTTETAFDDGNAKKTEESAGDASEATGSTEEEGAAESTEETAETTENAAEGTEASEGAAEDTGASE